MFDDIALTVVSMMSNCHTLVLCYNNYWTTHSNNEYKGCQIQLAYLNGNDFKDIVAKTGGAEEFLGTTASKQTLPVSHADHISTNATEMEDLQNTP